MDSQNSHLKQVYIAKELCNLIKSVKNVPFLTTWDEVVDGLRLYITQKKLFDTKQMKVFCKDDDLEQLFGVCEFTILDIKKLLQRLVFPIRGVKDSAEVPPSNPIVSDISSKRKTEEFLDEAHTKAKKICESVSEETCLHTGGCSSFNRADSSPMILHIPASPIRRESESESVDSVQLYETSYVKDTSDESVYFDDDDHSQILPEGIFTIAETFEVEYEPNSASEDSSICESDSNSDSDDFLSSLNSIITFVCKTDSDQEFWADKSSDENDSCFDAEISESDRWICNRCSSINNPPNRFCSKCFSTRKGWLASEKTERREKRKPRTNRKKHKKDLLRSSERKDSSLSANSKSFDLPCTSKESPSFVCEDFVSEKNPPMFTQSDKLCLLCCSKPVDSSIIHGKYAHTISCYRCAKRLQNANKRCPICRRTIEKVVYQISAL